MSAMAGPVCPEVPAACLGLGPKPVEKAGGGGCLENPLCLGARRVPEGSFQKKQELGRQRRAEGQSLGKGREWGQNRAPEDLE